ncbi:MAG: helix-turn-helix transcriptional regulator [Bacteroidota bacterium]
MEKFESLPLKVAILIEEVKAVKVLLLAMKNMSVDGEKVIDMDEVSKLTGYKKNTIYQLVHKKAIPYHKAENGGRKLIFFREEIESWLKGRKPETSEEFCERKELELYNS